MKKTALYLVCFVLLGFLFGQDFASAKVYLEVGKPELRKKLGILVMPVKGSGESALKITDIIESCLRKVGFVSLKNDELKGELLDESLLDKEDYIALGVDLILEGQFEKSGKTASLYIVLKDALFGKSVYSQVSYGKDIYSVSYRAMDDLVRHFTGEKGLFSTKIVFIGKRSKGTSQVYIVDFLGKHLEKLTRDESIKLSPRWVGRDRLVVTSYLRGQPDLFWLYIGSHTLSPVFKRNVFRVGGDLSPNGKLLVYSSNAFGNPEIVIADLETGSKKRLTRNFAIDVSPRWSPDGKYIAFVSNRSGTPQIYVMDANGRGVRRVTFSGKYNTTPSWSPKGDLIAFTGLFKGRMRICVVKPDGEDFRVLTQDISGESPSFSPDGKYLAFVMTDYGRRLGILDLSGKVIGILTPPSLRVFTPQWSPFWF